MQQIQQKGKVIDESLHRFFRPESTKIPGCDQPITLFIGIGDASAIYCEMTEASRNAVPESSSINILNSAASAASSGATKAFHHAASVSPNLVETALINIPIWNNIIANEANVDTHAHGFPDTRVNKT